MNTETTLIFAAVVVSWVMFVFNFVLGYYIGRAVQAGEKARKSKSSKNHNNFSSSLYSSFLPSSKLYPTIG